MYNKNDQHDVDSFWYVDIVFVSFIILKPVNQPQVFMYLTCGYQGIIYILISSLSLVERGWVPRGWTWSTPEGGTGVSRTHWHHPDRCQGGRQEVSPWSYIYVLLSCTTFCRFVTAADDATAIVWNTEVCCQILHMCKTHEVAADLVECSYSLPL